MGCDIHMFTEKKIGNRWETADFFHYVPNEKEEMELTRMEFMGDRNYHLFALLANVRNGFGIEPISTPRGIPKDLSEFVKVWYETEKSWTFGHSYLTLRDILEFQPEQYHYEDEDEEYLDEEDETLDCFIEKLKDRVKEIWWRFDYHPEEYLDNFRLVFWFDN